MHTLLRSGIACALAGVAAIVLASCSAPASSADAPAPPDPVVHTLTLTYAKPAVVGASVTASAAGLPAGRDAELRWGTVTGGWVIEDYYHFRGKKYSDSHSTLGTFPIDRNGRFEARFTIPEDYGGVHDVMVVVDGRTVAQNGIEVTQSFELSPTSGPVGTPIELRAKGKRLPAWQLDQLGLVGLLPPSPVKSDEPVESITLVPMGAARLRISSFPVVAEGPAADQ